MTAINRAAKLTPTGLKLPPKSKMKLEKINVSARAKSTLLYERSRE